MKCCTKYDALFSMKDSRWSTLEHPRQSNPAIAHQWLHFASLEMLRRVASRYLCLRLTVHAPWKRRSGSCNCLANRLPSPTFCTCCSGLRPFPFSSHLFFVSKKGIEGRWRVLGPSMVPRALEIGIVRGCDGGKQQPKVRIA